MYIYICIHMYVYIYIYMCVCVKHLNRCKTSLFVCGY